MKKAKKGDLEIWHIPQVPMTAFRIPVKNVEEATKILDVLADYDEFQFKHKVKPDYSNVQGLEEFDGKEWCEYYDDEGRDIQEIRKER